MLGAYAFSAPAIHPFGFATHSRSRRTRRRCLTTLTFCQTSAVSLRPPHASMPADCRCFAIPSHCLFRSLWLNIAVVHMRTLTIPSTYLSCLAASVTQSLPKTKVFRRPLLGVAVNERWVGCATERFRQIAGVIRVAVRARVIGKGREEGRHAGDTNRAAQKARWCGKVHTGSFTQSICKRDYLLAVQNRMGAGLPQHTNCTPCHCLKRGRE